jgi:serine protease AprX
MKKLFTLIAVLLFFVQNSSAQFTKHIIRLKDKATSPYSISNPSQYLSARALLRRNRHNIAIDSADLPITPRYIDSIRLAGAVTILNTSKWLNQVAIQTSDATALTKINSLPFVISVAPIAPRQATSIITKKFEDLTIRANTPTQNRTTADFYNYGQSYGQVHIHNGEFLHNRGFRGQGMHMAVMDGGFQNYLSMSTFDSVRNSGQILETWDFVTGNAAVNEDHNHGSNCLSTIGANMPGVFVGTAPKTNFYLYRTEDVNSEYPVEEQNFAAAAERADSSGVDLFSVSLGYTTFDNAIFNYTYTSSMNGNTAISSRAADVAAKKGILVVVANGNEGTSGWRYLSAPADGDSVLAVGAVNTAGTVAGFSSYGPSSDGQIKPNVAAVGLNAVVASTGNGQPYFSSGTSFACPNMAGLATCLWQAFPEVNNMTIINSLHQAANNANTPNDRVGYGVPDMKKAFVMLLKQQFTKQINISNCRGNVQFAVKTDSVINVVIERKLSTENNFTAINTLNSTGAFALRNFSFTDDLLNVSSSATAVTYRLKMNIATDTTFYLDSATISFAPKPALGADKNVSTCTGTNINLTTQFTTNGSTLTWTSNGNPVANPAAINIAGSYQLIATSTSGCADTAMITTNFLAKPNIGTDKNILKCTDSTVNLSNQFVTTGLSIAWSLNGNAINNTSAVSAPGSYQLIASATNGCADTALATITNNTALCPVIVEKISIGPSPANDVINVNIVRIAAAKASITITNTAGQKVYTLTNQQIAGGQTYNIPVKKLSAGIYYVTVMVNDKIEVIKKVMKR